MQTNVLKDALTADPFVPFRIRFGSGRVIDVLNPGLVAVSGSGRTAYVYQPKGDGGQFVDIMLIESLEFLNSPPRRRRAS